MKNQRFAYIISVVCLFVGAAIYFITRSENIFLNQWLTHFADGQLLRFFQGLISNQWLPDWILFSLPDALWMTALTIFILMIWDFKIHIRSMAWLALAVIAGTGLEIAQGFHLIRGTFDRADLLFIVFAASIPITITMLKQRLCAS